MSKTATPCLVLAKGIKIQRSKEGANIVFSSVFCNTLHLCGRRRADRTRARSRRRTLGGWRAFHIGTTRARAGRALTTLFLAGTVVNDDGLGFRNATLQDILTQIRSRRAFSLQHILAHVGTLRARRDCALQHILAEVGFAARRACRASIGSASTRR